MGVFEVKWILNEENRNMVSECGTIEITEHDGYYMLGDQFETEMGGFQKFEDALEEVAKRMLTTKTRRMSGLVLALVQRGSIKVRHVSSVGRAILKFPW